MKTALPIALAACAALGGCRRAPARTAIAASSPAAERHAVAAEPLPDDSGLLGMIIAPETVDVTSQLESRIKMIKVRAGDHVASGAVLATLDTRSARQEVAIAAAELAAARTEVERARVELAQSDERLARRQTVVQLPTTTVGTVSDEELSSSRFQSQLAALRVSSAEAAVAEKKGHLAQLSALLAEGAVRAPFSGTVTTRSADVGTLIHKGSPIVRMIEDGEPRVRFAIPEERLNALDLGDAVTIASAGQSFAGVVEKIAPEIDTASRMVFAEASVLVPSPARRLRSGQVARVRPAEHVESAR